MSSEKKRLDRTSCERDEERQNVLVIDPSTSLHQYTSHETNSPKITESKHFICNSPFKQNIPESRYLNKQINPDNDETHYSQSAFFALFRMVSVFGDDDSVSDEVSSLAAFSASFFWRFSSRSSLIIRIERMM